MLLFCFGISPQAKVGDVIGEALHTDIIVKINGYPISSYAVNGQSVFVAEDLRYIGFDVVWNQDTRSLALSRNNNPKATPVFVGKGYPTGQKYTDILETDIGVWAHGQKLTSYAMNGYTMIPVEELTMFGTVTWVPEERMLMMEIEDLEKPWDFTTAPIAYPYYENTDVPSFGWVTEKYCDDQIVKSENGVTVVNAYYQNISEADVQKYIAYLIERGWQLTKFYFDDTPSQKHWEYELKNPQIQCDLYMSLSPDPGKYNLFTLLAKIGR